MRIARTKAVDIAGGKHKLIGFWGAPPKEELRRAAEEHHCDEFLDLDVFYNVPKSGNVPDAYCHIIRNCVDNAVFFSKSLHCIVAATGQEKCDAGRYAADLVHRLTDLEVVRTTNICSSTFLPPVFCESRGSLKKRTVKIMEGIVETVPDNEIQSAKALRCEATHGFWGTPPHPIEVLDLFPDTTHIFGWTRCVEQGRPADLDLEMMVREEIPTVFFAQGFCAKSLLAKRLADENRGMYVDTHDVLGAATTAKIEAFIKLSAGDS